MNSKILSFAKTILPVTMLALFCGCHKEEQKPAPNPEAAAKPSGIVSAEKTSFDEVTSKLDKGGNLYVYLSTEQVLSGLSGKIGSLSNYLTSIPGVPGEQGEMIGKVIAFANNCLKDSGIEEISGLGASSIAREKGFYYTKTVVHHYPGQNAGAIWNAFGKEAHPLKELDLLPQETVLATFADLDVPLLWTNFQNHLAEFLADCHVSNANDTLQKWPDQFKKLTGLDFDQVLASLGGNYGIVMILDPDKKVSLPLPSGAMEIPSPSLAIVIKVNSDLIYDRVAALGKNNPLVVSVDKPDLKMRTMTIPLPLPIVLRPSIARSGDYLILATTDTMIEDMLAVKAGTKKGFKSTPEFVRLAQGIPETGNNFSIVGDQFVKSMMQVQQQALTNKGTMTAAQVDSMQHAFNNSTNYATYSVGANGPEGWEGFANGSQTLQSAIIPLVAGIGVAAAIAIPAYIKAHNASQSAMSSPNSTVAADPEAVQYNQIIKNLHALQAAKDKWAAAHGKTKGDDVTLDDLAPFLKNGHIHSVADEEYNPQPIGTLPSAHLAHDLHGHRGGSDIIAPAKKAKASQS